MSSIRVAVVAAFSWLLTAPIVLAQPTDALRARDVVIVTVINQPDLSKKYVIQEDGILVFPLIGRVQAGGLAPASLANEIRRRLADGFYANPEVTVDVERTRRVFVFGGVSSPGMYQLGENMTLIELLARAGYGSAAEVLILRAKGATGPMLPGTNPNAEVTHVNLREFEKDLEEGVLSRNVVLQDGDTVFVPRRDPNRIYISGQVHTPGAFSVADGTTLLQALALAGGPNERAALGKIKVYRLVNGKIRSFTVKLEDVVKPGDTILVPERLF